MEPKIILSLHTPGFRMTYCAYQTLYLRGVEDAVRRSVGQLRGSVHSFCHNRHVVSVHKDCNGMRYCISLVQGDLSPLVHLPHEL